MKRIRIVLADEHPCVRDGLTLLLNGEANLARQATGLESPRPAGAVQLSEQQTHVLRRVAWGYANKEIAERLQIGVKTVESYRTRLQRKLAIKSRPDLVLFALKQGWLKLP